MTEILVGLSSAILAGGAGFYASKITNREKTKRKRRRV
ncbi:hypothetical protein SULYE_1504 [Sulfurihydrogenibium yellowstonense SS-5]|uniref:Uncharacterized protein n=1 Tax=Sulfurihydrogenibium yellowstonense SS-5 TaxID=432331 RepID=C4FLQ0_9AQUI|nr:hypothetical protein SULYE_1504 [Sulfurihydrogenibium yellowstonense SS-5]